MNDSHLDPPETPEIPECCDEVMDVAIDGTCTCFTCGNVIHPHPDIEPIPDIDLPDDYGPSDKDECPHGIPYTLGCDACDHLSDIAYDTHRERR